MTAGFDDDLAGESTRIANRLRGLLTQIHPSLERVLGPRIQHPDVLRLLDQFGSPAQIRKAGRRRLVTLIRPKAPRTAERLIEDIFTALDEQTVVVPGTDAAALIVPSLAGSLQSVLDQRKLLAAESRGTFGGPPSFPVLIPIPGIEIRTAARILIDVGDGGSTTSPPSSHSPDAVSTSSSPCSATAPSTSHPHPLRLDESHRGTFFALAWAESRATRETSTRPASSSRSTIASCSRPQTPALDQIVNRRCTVDFDIPKHGGNARQAHPLTST